MLQTLSSLLLTNPIRQCVSGSVDTFTTFIACLWHSAPNAFVLSQGISNRFNSKNTQTNLQSPWSLQSRHMSASTTMWLTDVFLIIFGSLDSSVCLLLSVLFMSRFFLYNPDSRNFGTLRKPVESSTQSFVAPVPTCLCVYVLLSKGFNKLS